MNAKQINQTFDLIGYVEGIVPIDQIKHTSLYILAPCPICGEGRDRFNIKRTSTGQIWVCRKCAGDHYHSVIDFMMKYKNIDFKEALKMLGGSLEKPTRLQMPAPKKEVYNVPGREWQREALQEMDSANRRLGTPQGEPGRVYLEGRGLHSGTWDSLMLGYGLAYGRPAIFIPWLSGFDEIAAVKYRFLDGTNGNRFACKQGSKQYLYNLLHVSRDHRNLVIVEGELNAASIHQLSPEDTSVVSIGGDTNGGNGLVKSLAAKFEKVFVWLDDASKNPLPGAKVIQSPVMDGVKFDANQILQAGVLAAFLESQLNVQCLGYEPTRGGHE